MTAVLEAPAARTGHDTVPLPRLLAAELRWIFRRPRTLAVLGLLALIPIVIGIGLTLVSDNGGPDAGGPNPDGALLASAVNNAFVLPIAAIVMSLALLLPLASAMAGADAIAGEASHGTLRGWLIAPVGIFIVQGKFNALVGGGGQSQGMQQMGYAQGGGYPPQGGGYPPQGGGYPPQGGGGSWQ